MHYSIGVGSTNPSKVSGVRRALKLYFKDFDLVPVHVDNCVGPQPIGFEEVLLGARCRAKNVFSSRRDFFLGVGLEAGIVDIGNRYFVLQVCCIRNSSGEEFFGMSSAFEAPKRVVDEVVLGMFSELEEAVVKYSGIRDIGDREGLIGLLSGGRVVREDLSFQATLMALINLFSRDILD